MRTPDLIRAMTTLFPLLLALGACGGEPTTVTGPPTDGTGVGSVRVSVTATGAALDADGYDLVVDGVSRLRLAGPDSSSVSLQVAPGRRLVALRGVQGNCTIDQNDRAVEVGAGQVVQVAFGLSCTATALRASIALTGENRDSSGVSLLLGVAEGGPETAFPFRGGAIDLAAVPSGAVAARLAGVSGNCLDDIPAEGLMLPPNGSAEVKVSVQCEALGASGIVLSDGFTLFRLADGWRAPVPVEMGYNPSWSPDGARIAFSRAFAIQADDGYGGTFRASGLFTTTFDGVDTRTLNKAAMSPRYLPDGRLLPVDDVRWGVPSSNVDVLDWTTDLQVLLGVRRSGWNDQGRRVADTLVLMAPGGTTLATLFTSREHITRGRLSPDGRRVAVAVYPEDDGYRHEWPCAGCQVWIMNRDGTGRHRLAGSAASTYLGYYDGYNNGSLAWSPDGSRLLAALQDSPWSFSLVSVRAEDGGDARVLWSGGSMPSADWR